MKKYQIKYYDHRADEYFGHEVRYGSIREILNELIEEGEINQVTEKDENTFIELNEYRDVVKYLIFTEI